MSDLMVPRAEVSRVLNEVLELTRGPRWQERQNKTEEGV